MVFICHANGLLGKEISISMRFCLSYGVDYAWVVDRTSAIAVANILGHRFVQQHGGLT